jgi:hypothetical protein
MGALAAALFDDIYTEAKLLSRWGSKVLTTRDLWTRSAEVMRIEVHSLTTTWVDTTTEKIVELTRILTYRYLHLLFRFLTTFLFIFFLILFQNAFSCYVVHARPGTMGIRPRLDLTWYGRAREEKSGLRNSIFCFPENHSRMSVSRPICRTSVLRLLNVFVTTQ